MKLTLLRFVTPFSLVQKYQVLGDICSLHLQDVLKKVAVLPINTPYLYAPLIMLVYTYKPSTSPQPIYTIYHVFYNSVLPQQTVT